MRLPRNREHDGTTNPKTGGKMKPEGDGYGFVKSRKSGPFAKSGTEVYVKLQCMEHNGRVWEVRVDPSHVKESEEKMEEAIITDAQRNVRSMYRCPFCVQNRKDHPELPAGVGVPRLYRRPVPKLRDRETL